MAIGAVSVVAAWFYTGGSRPYGYAGLGEVMVFVFFGPVAVVGGSRITMPYAMAVLGGELMRACFSDRQPTAGELLLASKRNSVLRDRADEESQMLDSAARAFSPQSSDLEAERREHLALFNLIGDPLLRIPHGGEVRLTVPARVTAGEPLEVLVNHRLVARGEVVVVNEKFGVRLTDVVSPVERVQKLG